MSFIVFLAKIYIVILIFRMVATKQELNFNPVGRFLAAATNPILPKNGSNGLIVLYILILVLGTSLISGISSSLQEFILDSKKTFIEYLKFFMLFFIVSIILGSFGNRPIGGGFIAYFFRIGYPWVKLTRLFIPINSGKIIYPAIVVVYLVYVSSAFLLEIVFNVILYRDPLNVVSILLLTLGGGAIKIFDLAYYMSFIILFRALISWVSPDPRNIVVQLLYTITEPILEPFRRIIPPIGIFDLSAMVAMFLLFFIGNMGQYLIGKLMVLIV